MVTHPPLLFKLHARLVNLGLAKFRGHLQKGSFPGDCVSQVYSKMILGFGVIVDLRNLTAPIGLCHLNWPPLPAN